MQKRLWTLLMIAMLAVPMGAARADSFQDSTKEAERLASEALARIMRALNLLADSVPQYAAPEVLPNGDIIIRRLHREESDDEPIETNGGDSGAGVET